VKGAGSFDDDPEFFFIGGESDSWSPGGGKSGSL